MRLLFALLVTVAATVCAHAQDITRLEMAGRLASVKVGMSESEALAICGPGIIHRSENQRDGYSILYGVVGDSFLATLGSIHIHDGKVLAVGGGTGTVIDPSVLPEGELRSYLAAIGDLAYLVIVARPTTTEWLPEVIRFSNALRPLGKDRIVAILKEYVRVRYDHGTINEFDCLSVLIRLLDEESTSYSRTVLSPVLPRPDNLEVHPQYPIMFSEGLPILVPLYFDGRGSAFNKFDELETFEKIGRVRVQPIKGPKNPFTSLLKMASGPEWPTPAWWQKGEPSHLFGDDYKDFRDTILMQVLNYCDGLGGTKISTENKDAWLTTVAHYEDIFRESGYVWDVGKSKYVIAAH